MKEFMILLRGVMPKGKNKVPMGLLKEALTEAGLEEVRTYIASGNAIAQSKLSKSQLEKLVHEVIADSFGGDISVVAHLTSEFRKLFEENPFHKKKPEHVYFTFLGGKLDPEKLAELQKLKFPVDQFVVADPVIYHYCPGPYSKSKVNNAFFERKLGIPTTTRISRTVAKMLEMAGSNLNQSV